MKRILNYEISTTMLWFLSLGWMIFLFLVYLACMFYLVHSFLSKKHVDYQDVAVGSVAYYIHRRRVKPFLKHQKLILK